MVTKATLTCNSCGKSFEVEEYHAGFSHWGFVYCDKDSTVALWNEITDRKYRELVGRKIPWWLNTDEKESVEEALKPCPCGGRFRFANKLSCPVCGEPLAEGISERNIYVYVMDRLVDGE